MADSEGHSPISGPLRFRMPGLALVPVMLAVSVLVVACSSTPQTTLEPATEQAERSLNLLMLVFWAGLGVFVVVEGALVYAIVRYRRRPGDGIPTQTHGNHRLEIAWTIAPAVMVAVLAAFTVPVIFANANAPVDPNPIKVRVIAHQWWFEFRYPGLGVTTANEMHIPVGQEVELQLESEDVIHSFWVPALRGKMDMVPGRLNRIVITPQKTGTFEGQCAEFCGVAHALMKFTVVVDEPGQFDAWVARQIEDRAPPTNLLAEQGEALLVTGGCIACHTIRGTPAQGVIGPDLTHVGSRAKIAAGVLPNTTDNLASWLRDPQAVKAGNKMVIRQLGEYEIDALVTYLQGLK